MTFHQIEVHAGDTVALRSSLLPDGWVQAAVTEILPSRQLGIFTDLPLPHRGNQVIPLDAIEEIRLILPASQAIPIESVRGFTGRELLRVTLAARETTGMILWAFRGTVCISTGNGGFVYANAKEFEVVAA